MRVTVPMHAGANGQLCLCVQYHHARDQPKHFHVRNLVTVLLDRRIDLAEVLHSNGLEPVFPHQKVFHKVTEGLPSASRGIILAISQDLDFVRLMHQANDCDTEASE